MTVQLDIVSAAGKLFSGSVKSVQVMGSEGGLGILPNHAPLLTTLKPGIVRIVKSLGEQQDIYVGGGIMEVQPDSITVLADERF